MYSRNVGPRPRGPGKAQRMIGRIVNSLWRWEGRKLAYRQDDVIHGKPGLAMVHDYTELARRDAESEPSQGQSRELPGAELTEEQRRQAVDDATRRPRFG